MGRYWLSSAAASDIEAIYLRGVVEFGERQADAYHDELHQTFEMLAAYPAAARERSELGAGVRVHPKSAHLIAYRIVAGGILVVRVVHKSMDWQSLL